jgi:hypothetical protein
MLDALGADFTIVCPAGSRHDDFRDPSGPRRGVEVGDRITLEADSGSLHFFDTETEARIDRADTGLRRSQKLACTRIARSGCSRW